MRAGLIATLVAGSLLPNCLIPGNLDNALDPFGGNGFVNGVILLLALSGGFRDSRTALLEGDSANPSVHEVQLNPAPTAEVRVTIRSADGRLNINEQGTTSVVLVFTPENYLNFQSVRVFAANDDYDLDGTVSAELQHTAESSDSGYSGKNLGTSTYTITDDDTRGLAFSGGSAQTDEVGGNDVVQVRLTSRPVGDLPVTVNFSSSNVAAGTVNPLFLIFTAANWNVNQPLTITGQDVPPNFLGTASTAYSIVSATISGSGTDYDGLDPGDYSVTHILRKSFRMFVTAPHTGDFGGVAGADTFCNAQAPVLTPALRSSKAMLVDGVVRNACTSTYCKDGAGEHVDWVLQPSAEYYRQDGATRSFVTDALSVVPAGPDIENSTSTEDRTNYWTGLTTEWTTHADTCGGWANLGLNGMSGRTEMTNDRMRTDTVPSFACGSGIILLLCIEQP